MLYEVITPDGAVQGGNEHRARIYPAGEQPAAGAISLRQSYECWKQGADPIEFAKEHSYNFV